MIFLIFMKKNTYVRKCRIKQFSNGREKNCTLLLCFVRVNSYVADSLVIPDNYCTENTLEITEFNDHYAQTYLEFNDSVVKDGESVLLDNFCL